MGDRVKVNVVEAKQGDARKLTVDGVRRTVATLDETHVQGKAGTRFDDLTAADFR